MKTVREWPAFTVTKKAAASLAAGHPWVYDNEITAAPDQLPEPGALADVFSPRGSYLGTAFYSPASRIRLRVISKNANDKFDEAFWQRRIEYAWAYRRQVMGQADCQCCRVIFGEADQMPGLTVDRFGPLLSVQITSVGMERIKDLILPLIVRVLRADGQRIDGVFERNDLALRDKESLPRGKGWYPPSRRNPPRKPVDRNLRERCLLRSGRGERPENRLFPGSEIQPTGGGKAGCRAHGAGLFYPHRQLCPERCHGRCRPRDGRGRERHSH